MFANACGQAKDYAKAVMFYQKGAAQGNARAQCNLGYMYDAGKGIVNDKVMAAKYYQLSANQGYSVAQCNLGYMYQWGLGVPRDNRLMLHYYMQAAEMNNPRALSYIMDIFKGCEGDEILKLAHQAWEKKIFDISHLWPLSNPKLCPPCRLAIREIFYCVKEFHTPCPKELIFEITKFVIQVWEHPNPYIPTMGVEIETVTEEPGEEKEEVEETVGEVGNEEVEIDREQLSDLGEDIEF